MIGCNNNVLLRASCSWSPAIAGYIVTVLTREGGGMAQDYGHHMVKADLILAVEFRGRFRFRLAPLDVPLLCEKSSSLLLLCTRTEHRELFPAESPLFFRSPTSLAGLSFLVAFPRRSLRNSRQVLLFLLDWVHCFTSYLLLVLLFLRQQSGLLWL
jgi:hypothetical protein